MTTRHPLAELREHLLNAKDPGKLLLMADNYLQSMQKMGNSFVLPHEHTILAPILEYYAGDLRGWVKYVKGIRDRLVRGTEAWDSVYVLYRTLEIRAVQRERRERLSAAVDKAVALGLIEDDVEIKRRYANRCTNEWARMRTARLDSLRAGTSRKRISEDERNEILKEFWDEIDQLIAAGEVPTP